MSATAAVISFPGSNRERDIVMALARAGWTTQAVWHGDSAVPACDLIVLPGGFSYGDYLRGGAMAAHSPIMRDVAAKVAGGVAALGVCNGFQILTEAGLLPGVLARNAGLRFLSKTVALSVGTAASPFTGGYAADQTVAFPIAHNEGCYLAQDEDLKRLADEDRIAFRYVDDVNGSAGRIAGVLSENRRVLGLMPHPENAVDPACGGTDGAALFSGALAALAA